MAIITGVPILHNLNINVIMKRWDRDVTFTIYIYICIHTHMYKSCGNDFDTHELTHEAKSYLSFHHSCLDTLVQGQCLHNLQNNFTHINYFRSGTKLSCTIKHS